MTTEAIDAPARTLDIEQLSATAPNQIQFVRTFASNSGAEHRFTKTYRLKNDLLHKVPPSFPKHVVPMALTARDLASAIDCLKLAEADECDYCMILGALNRADKRDVEKLLTRGHVSRTKIERTQKDVPTQLPCFTEVPRHLYAIDFDPTPAQKAWCKSQGLDVYADPEAAVRACVAEFLPEELKHCSYAYQLSAGAGLSEDQIVGGHVRDPAKIKFHLFFWLETPRLPRVVKVWVQAQSLENIARGMGDVGSNGSQSGGIDLSLYHAVQPHFISVRFEGCDDPLAGKRWGLIEGDKFSLDEVSYTDGYVKDGHTICNHITAIESRYGERRVRRTTEINGKSINAWPHGWRERLCLMAPGMVNETIKATTWALARDLERQHGVEAANAETLKRPYLEQIWVQVQNTPGKRSDSELEKNRADIDRLFEGALPQVAARRAVREAAADTRGIVIPPLHADTRVSLAEGEAILDASINKWFGSAIETWQARKENEVNHKRWIEAGCQKREKKSAFPYPLRLPPKNQIVVAGEPGLGKTRAIVTGFLASGLQDKFRLYISVPNHDKAEELKAAYLMAATEAGIENAPVTVFKGLDRACQADESRKEAALTSAQMGLSPKKAVCVKCPLCDSCDWLAQSKETGPGLKILVSAYLGVSIPGVSRGGKEDGDGAPILGFVLDERYDQSITHETLVLANELPAAAFYNNSAFRLSRDDKKLLDHAVKILGRTLRKTGTMRVSDFAAITRDHVVSEGECVRKHDVILRKLEGIVWALKEQAAAEIRKALAEGRTPDVAKSLKQARLIENVRAFFDLLWSVERAGRGPSAGRNSDDIPGCRVERDVSSGQQALRMHWTKRLPEEVRLLPVLVLNATASQKRCNLPFVLRDDVGGYELLPEVEFIPIRLRPRSERLQFLLKIINAPVARHNFEDHAFEEAHGEQTTSNRSRNRERDTRQLKRMRADAHWVKVLNVVEAIIGRAISEGGTAGLISYKGHQDYLNAFRPLKGVRSGHFGAVAGLNVFEDVDVLIVVGRNMPNRDALISKTEALYALDPEGRRPDQDAIVSRATQGLRVTGESNGVACRAEVPTCPLVDDVYMEVGVGETVQAIGRARGVRRTEDRPVLIIDISNTVPDLTYDAVIDWNDIEGTTELAAVMHAKGVVPMKPSDLEAIAPHHFTGQSETRQTAFDLFKRTKSTKRSSALKCEQAPITSLGDELRIEHFVQLTMQNALAGDISRQKLLTPAAPETARYQTDGRTLKDCYVDGKRRDVADSALRSALNCELLSSSPPKKRSPHRPRQQSPSKEALRMRYIRECRKLKEQESR